MLHLRKNSRNRVSKKRKDAPQRREKVITSIEKQNALQGKELTRVSDSKGMGKYLLRKERLDEEEQNTKRFFSTSQGSSLNVTIQEGGT